MKKSSIVLVGLLGTVSLVISMINAKGKYFSPAARPCSDSESANEQAAQEPAYVDEIPGQSDSDTDLDGRNRVCSDDEQQAVPSDQESDTGSIIEHRTPVRQDSIAARLVYEDDDFAEYGATAAPFLRALTSVTRQPQADLDERLEILETILEDNDPENGPNPLMNIRFRLTAEDPLEYTPLLYALAIQNLDLLTTLATYSDGINVETGTDSLGTPVEFLDMLSRAPFGNRAFIQAARMVIQELLDQPFVDVLTSITDSYQEADMDLLQELLEVMDLTARPTPLMQTVFDYEGRDYTPLYYAMFTRNLPLLELLLEYSTADDIRAQPDTTPSALEWAESLALDEDPAARIFARRARERFEYVFDRTEYPVNNADYDADEESNDDDGGPDSEQDTFGIENLDFSSGDDDVA